jgi:hypothetical protein
LHRLAAAQTRIAVARDDDTLPSLLFPAQIAPYENTNARKMRASARMGNLEARIRTPGARIRQPAYSR